MAAEAEKKAEKPASEAKKKKRVAVAPPCPPSVATAHLSLLGAVLGVVGVSMDDAAVSVIQNTFLRDKAPTGKFAIGLGKKLGCGALQLPEDPVQQDQLLDAIQAAANRMVAENIPIATYQMTKAEAVATFGTGILNASHKKTKDGDTIKVCAMKDVVAAVPAGVPFASTGAIASVSVERGANASGVACGKKARKAETTIYFRVTERDGEQVLSEIMEHVPTDTDFSELRKPNIRCPEGLDLQRVAEERAAEAEKAASEAKTAAESSKHEEQEMVVNAFEVSGKIDYNKLVEKFGSKIIEPDLLKKLESLTVGQGRVPKLHRFLRRNIFFSHRDLDVLLETMEKKKPMYLYTGRGPSSAAMHLGHLVPFLFTQWLQQAFGCPLVIQMTDDEKFLFKGTYTDADGDNLQHFASLTMENARDIIACGFDFEKTFLFSDLEYIGRMYPNICRIWKAVTTNTVNGIFGFDGTSNIGKVAFPAVQAAPSFASSFPTVLGVADEARRDTDYSCLIPCAIDQDPYFRMTRDIAHKLVSKGHALGGKPALIHSKFFPPLQGAEGKMSSSDTNSAIFLTDTPEDIERKIKQHAFSGGKDTKELQQEHGADLEVDVAYQWLRFFLEDDDELEAIGKSYGSGKGDFWSTGLVKARLVQVLQELVSRHQERRAKITDEEVRKWMSERFIG